MPYPGVAICKNKHMWELLSGGKQPAGKEHPGQSSQQFEILYIYVGYNFGKLIKCSFKLEKNKMWSGIGLVYFSSYGIV